MPGCTAALHRAVFSGENEEVSYMYACVGDRLIVEGDPARAGLIIGVPQRDGSPPYIVRWLASGHTAMVSPGQFARIVPAQRPEPLS
jgi:Domain of unknown function (DUF1918)